MPSILFSNVVTEVTQELSLERRDGIGDTKRDGSDIKWLENGWKMVI